MATLSIANLLDLVVAREDVSAAIGRVTREQSAVGRMLAANGRSIRRTSGVGALSYTTLDTPSFSTWDNSSEKTASMLSGNVGEVQYATAYAIVAYPINYEEDIESFSVEFASAMANGFARHIDDTVLNTATTGVLPMASGVSNFKATTTVSPTSYQLRTDLVDTMGLVYADGYEVNGIIGEVGETANVLNAVGTNGVPVFTIGGDGRVSNLLGQAYATTKVDLNYGARFVVGDWTKLAIAMRDDLKFTRFDSGIVTISGTDHNLIQENLVAVRAEARMAFVVSQADAFAYLYNA